MRQFKNVEIILEESQAVLANSLYIIPLGNGKAKAIVTDANGNKVAITSDVPENIATTDYEDVNGQIVSGNTYNKTQINVLLQELYNGGNIDFEVNEDMELIQTWDFLFADFELVNGELIINN